MFNTGFDLTRAMYKRAMLEATSRRKDEAGRMLDYFNDGQLEYVLEDIQRRYPNPGKLYPISLNVVKKIIRGLAMVYMKDAVRSVDGSDADKDILSEIETTAALAMKMKQANRYSKLLGTVMLRPVWRNGRMEMDILTPDVLDVDTGDTPEDIKAVQVTHYSPVGDVNELSFSLWTPDFVRHIDANGHIVSEEANPYGMLPFVPCWSQPPTDFFWQRGARDLMMIQDAINRLLTIIGYTIDFQGFSTAYIKGAEEVKDGDWKMGPGNLISLPINGEIGFVAPNAPVDKVLAAVDVLLKQAAVTNGLPASTMATEVSDQSGVARVVANRELEEMRADDVALFTEYERRLFSTFRAVWNVHNPGRQLSDSAVFQINFYDPKPTMTASEQAQVWERLMGLGILSPVDVMLERDPDLTRDEAKARLLMVRDELKEFGSNFAALA